MENKFYSGKNTFGKGGKKGNKMWQAHRLEGIVNKKANRPIRKKKGDFKKSV